MDGLAKNEDLSQKLWELSKEQTKLDYDYFDLKKSSSKL